MGGGAWPFLNPVNHHLLECMLHTKPLGQRHFCLGVKHRVNPHTLQGIACGKSWPPMLLEDADGLNASPRQWTSQQVVVETQLSLFVAASTCTPSSELYSREASSTEDWANVSWKGVPKRVTAPLYLDPAIR
ncbi:hypothetical protein H5410_015201 [Solanum commersonii]|uniref:Uncharacterized protein n=1 Tax=Solanum commersonii TaxID=4109 RepID=A0A9J5ZT55_SOLCO|nr:hypothetical protein H5410_015201 [Solanum commersonii]